MFANVHIGLRRARRDPFARHITLVGDCRGRLLVEQAIKRETSDETRLYDGRVWSLKSIDPGAVLAAVRLQWEERKRARAM